MKYALSASITATILLLIIVGFLLLKLSHGTLHCEMKASFNQTEVVLPTDVTDPLTDEQSKKQKNNTPKASRGVFIPAPAPPVVGIQEK